ncbi:MAG: hypothetical protein HRU30_10695 [Rhodobacteraceae bacterium]|nr:hypothetical protein [Paracoccaceae bacterium]
MKRPFYLKRVHCAEFWKKHQSQYDQSQVMFMSVSGLSARRALPRRNRRLHDRALTTAQVHSNVLAIFRPGT